MTGVLLSLVATIVLGGSFGEATAVGGLDGERLEVDFEVEVAGDPVAVAVHVVDPGHDQETFSLIDRGGGRWGGFAAVEPINFVIVFEVLYADTEGAVSRPTTLVELGVEADLLGIPAGPPATQDEEEGLSRTSRRWLWGSIALGAVALALVAVWAMGDRRPAPAAAPPSEGEAAPDHEEGAQGGPAAGPDG